MWVTSVYRVGGAFFSVYIVALVLIPFVVSAAEADSDSDGILDNDEVRLYATDPLRGDTDGDGFTDGDEIKNGYSPHSKDRLKLIRSDIDNDYLNDAWELLLGTGIKNPDSDGDKYLDGTEVVAGFDPLRAGQVKRDKLITVDLAKQHLEYFFGSVKLASFPVSGGLASMPTPKGDFSVLAKVPVKHYGGADFNYPNTKWNLHFATQRYRYFIHGAYWHNDFGRPKSHGCVNVSYENMEPLYWFAQTGARVAID